MKVSVEMDDRIAVATIEGEIDLANRMHISDEVLGRMPDEAIALIIDLSSLSYIDSAGVRSIFEIASTLSMREQKLAIAVPEGSVLRSVLKITNVEEVAPICANRKNASEILGAGT